jgi:hypothetical protein
MKYLALFLVLLVVGCAGSPETRSKTALATACKSHATLLNHLETQNLSPERVKRVQDSIVLLRPVCGKDSTFDPSLGVTVVRQAMEMLK